MSTLRGVMSALGTTIGNERSNNKHLNEEVQRKLSQMQIIEAILRERRVELQSLEDKDLSESQRNREIENILKVKLFEIVTVILLVDSCRKKLVYFSHFEQKFHCSNFLSCAICQFTKYHKKNYNL